MARFWDRRAEEDPFYFIDSRIAYREPDLAKFWANGEQDLDALLSTLGESLGPGDHVVEVGCGIGRLTRAISSRAASVQAVDVSERMLELAREYNGSLANVEWLQGDGATLAGIESESADACISHVVFQHIPDPQITLSYVREIGRVLRPGGWAAFQISNNPRVHAPRQLRARLRESVLATVGRAPGGQHDQRWRGSMIELPELRSAASDGSMDVERVVGEGTQFCCVLTRSR
jgi:ubiquinone/menaquinone biosynthesis C-methylase UbiE